MSISLAPDTGSGPRPGGAASTSLGRWQSDLKAYFNIIYALIMHDIKNRFFGSGVGQIVMVFWPFAHILLIITIAFFLRRPNPFGSSLVQYSAISVFPFICANYCTRWIVFSAMTNRSFLQYPIVKPLDIILARGLLELVSITVVAALMIIFLMCMGDDAMPVYHAEAVYAVCATMFLSIGLGVPNAVIAMIIPMWNIVVTLAIIACYPLSGIFFVASELPEQLRVPLSYNPVLQCTEWLRSAYYVDYPLKVLDKAYVLEFGLVSLTFGLVLERLLRRFF